MTTRHRKRRIARTLGCAIAAFSTLCASAVASETPKPGGVLEIATLYRTLPTLSWDPADWGWKTNHDTGQMFEQLFAADLTKAKRLGGPHAFYADAWLPSDAIRGELAERWEWKQNPLRLEVTLRDGVRFPEKPGVMAARDLVADDVVYAYNRLLQSPKKTAGYYDYLEKVEATGPKTVVFTFKKFNSEWDYRFGYGYYSGIYPKEVVEAGITDWKKLNGTGPFMLTDFVQGNAATYTRNPDYWGSATIGGQTVKLPLLDKLVFRNIRDLSTANTALRQGKIDMLESVRWSDVEPLKKSAPQLQWARWLSMSGQFLAMRMDTKPFDDVRVRRALNMAVNKQEIIDAYYGGQAELFSHPQHPDYTGYYEPLDKMPDSVRELYVYDPARAKKLLAEAGYPNGFTFKVQVCACNPDHMELLPLVAAYLEQVGVRLDIQPMEYGSFLATILAKTHAPGLFSSTPHSNPTTTLRTNFLPGQQANTAIYRDPDFDRRLAEAYGEQDEPKRQAMIKALTREIVDKAPYIWLPTPYVFTAWWPWVKNYGGELRAGANRPGPIYARIWIDQEMKKKMGY